MFYQETCTLMLTSRYAHLVEEQLPAIQSAFKQYNRDKPLAQKSRLLKLVGRTWKSNVTMIDLEWHRSGSEIDLGFNPFEFGFCLQLPQGVALEATGLSDLVSAWLVAIGTALSIVKHRIQIEVCVGEVTQLLEQIRYGVVEHRQPSDARASTDLAITSSTGSENKSKKEVSIATASVSPTPSVTLPSNVYENKLNDYPKLYDRIHLSNIPDYIGGTLTTFMYALPLIHPEKQTYITSNCLRNPLQWQLVAHFNNEYIGLSSPQDLEKVFHMRTGPPPHTTSENPLAMFTPMPMAEYYEWHHNPRSKELPDLMPRPALETWLHQPFFKICLPKERKIVDMGLILSPLNLTAFIRLCIHLHSIGYPGHWISGVLDDIVSGSITTRARPPRSCPHKIREVRTEMPPLYHV